MSTIYTHDRRDAALLQTEALPAAPGTVVFAGLDLGPLGTEGPNAQTDKRHKLGHHSADVVLVVDLPAFDVTQLPDAATIDVLFEQSDTDDFAETESLGEKTVVIGADGAGAAAASSGVRLPLDAKRHVRATLTAAGTGDLSTLTADLGIGY